jgi:hypothetical protein
MMNRSFEAVGVPLQDPEHVARAAVLLMADATRHGQLVSTEAGQHTEFEEAMRRSIAEILEVDFADQLPAEELTVKLMTLAA